MMIIFDTWDEFYQEIFDEHIDQPIEIEGVIYKNSREAHFHSEDSEGDPIEE